MRNAKLTILASLSLVTLAALAWGYVGMLGLSIDYVSVTPSGKALRTQLVDVAYGHFDVGSERLTDPYPIKDSPGLRIHPLCRFKPSSPADDCLWLFHIGRSSPQTFYSWAGLVCPLWFAALPCTIAPIAWLRRRRRGETRGFAVEGREGGSQPSQPRQASS